MISRNYTLYNDDCLEKIKGLDSNSIDSVVTDPPYHLQSIVSRFKNTSPLDNNKTGENSRKRNSSFSRLAVGFMGKEWDGGDIAFHTDIWSQCLRVLKPGAHLVAFGGTRTYHRMVVAIEDSGFEIRDQIGWLYGTGFPKSYDVSQCIEKKLTTGKTRRPDRNLGGLTRNRYSGSTEGKMISDTGGKVELTHHESKKWKGWGTALKPAWEPIVLARKPLEENTVAENVLAHGTGAINIDESKVEGSRWPANIMHDGSDEVMQSFSEFGDVARFFYSAKASKEDRENNSHPTVKPNSLMRYLCKMITPEGGTILDPFMGSGSTGKAAVQEGYKFVGIEREKDYFAIAEHRLKSIPNTLFD